MRAILVVACVGLGACAVDNELQYRSTVSAETRGVALSDDGLTSYAAMVDTTCALDTHWGCSVNDENLPTDDERVVDHYDGRTLAQSADRLFWMNGDTWNGDEAEVPQLRAARLSDTGLLSLHGGGDSCAFSAGEDVIEVDGALCAEGVRVAVDRRGAIVAATAQGVFRADRVGVTRIADSGDRVAVDASLGQIYVATAGSPRVTAYDDAGVVRWTANTTSAVTDIAVRGDKLDLLVLAAGDNGTGLLRRIDGETGEEVSVGRLPDGHGEVVTSLNGRMIAIVTPTAIHHYEMVVEGEADVVNDEEVTCGELPVRNSTGVGTE